MVAELFADLVGPDPVVQALAGGVVIAALNLLGASLVLVWRDPSERALDGALGFAAGVMLSAAFTSLVLPGIEFATEPGYAGVVIAGAELDGVLPVMVGLVLGVAFLDRADAVVPHAHYLLTGRRRAD
ncbi:MAG: ZIP family metal transporter, partial [Halobacteriaceae archaeon]